MALTMVNDASPPLLSLADAGIEEVEPGTVEDSYWNRKRLRELGYVWTQALDREGDTPTVDSVPLLYVSDPRAYEGRKAQQREHILEDARDHWSEYIDPRDLAYNADAPYWVKMGAQKWQRMVADGKNPADEGMWLPFRCTAIKPDGYRCWNWAGTSRVQLDMKMCKVHCNQGNGQIANYYIKTAKDKLAQAAPAMVDELEKLALTAEKEETRLKAMDSILDRAGVRGGIDITQDVTVTQVDAAAIVRERLAQLANRNTPALPSVTQVPANNEDEATDAEVVE